MVVGADQSRAQHTVPSATSLVLDQLDLTSRQEVQVALTDLHLGLRYVISDVAVKTFTLGSGQSCPQGTLWSGNRCSSAADRWCPSGFVYVAYRGCVQADTPTRLCGVGYVMQGGRCQHPNRACDAGQTWRNGSCQDRNEEACPAGRELLHGTCRRIVEQVCPPRHTWSNSQNRCVVAIAGVDAAGPLPPVTINFGATTYNVTEGSSTTIRVTLSRALQQQVTIPLTTTHQNGADSGDYSGVPTSLTFGNNETVKTFSLATTDDTADDDNESVQLAFGSLPSSVSAGPMTSTTVAILDNDFIINFGAATYSVTEGAATTVRVTLSSAPQQQVTIPLTATHQDGASSGDYSGVPASLTFGSTETAKTVSFAATNDTADDDDESVQLGFGTLPSGVYAGTVDSTTVSITDLDITVDLDPAQGFYTEGNSGNIRVTIGEVSDRDLTIPLTVTYLNGATAADWSGIASSVSFTRQGARTVNLSFTITDDTADDDSESIQVGFGTLPANVLAGTVQTATVNISDNDDPAN